MPEFWKDGKKVECRAIYDHGKVGQVVILDFVHYPEKLDLEKYPLAQYPQPSVFTIMRKVEGKNGHYVTMDAKGDHVTLQDSHFGASTNHLYDAGEYLVWQEQHVREKLARKEHKIEQLQGHVDLLKDILTKQGIRLVPEQTAKMLGIA